MSDTGDQVIDLNFVPEWARQPASQTPSVRFEGRAHDRPRREEGRRRSPPFAGRAGRADPERRPASRGRPRPGGERPAPARPEPERIPVRIAFIPERAGLKPLADQMLRSGRAYPLFEVAALFLSKPEFYAVKQELAPEAERAGLARLFQCALCKQVFLDRTGVATHVLARHGDLYYHREDIEVEPPKGQFRCVARCPLSGELLGPPNHHAFNERVLDLHRTRFANMSLEAYRQRIVNETDPALIERWKAQCVRQAVYRTRRAEPPLEFKRRSEMEAHFRAHYERGLIRDGARFITPGVVCRETEDARLRQAIEDAWARETRFPLNLAMAIQPAFRHLGLHPFRSSGKAMFVAAIAPHPLDPAGATPVVRAILEGLHRNPGLRRQDLLAALYPALAPGAPEVAEVLQALRWLVDKGHVIEFHNGTLAVPAFRPAPGRAAGPA